MSKEIQSILELSEKKPLWEAYLDSIMYGEGFVKVNYEKTDGTCTIEHIPYEEILDYEQEIRPRNKKAGKSRTTKPRSKARKRK